MSRRKQSHPSRLLDSEGSAQPNNTVSDIVKTAAEEVAQLQCNQCLSEFSVPETFESHLKLCTAALPEVSEVSSALDADRSPGDVPEDEIRRSQDFANNNQSTKNDAMSREGSIDKQEDSSDVEESSVEDTAEQISPNNLPQYFPFLPLLPSTNVALEALQNTKVAVAQFAVQNPAAAQELNVLQSTIFTLQQQQMLQLQLIQQLQHQLQITRAKEQEEGKLTEEGGGFDGAEHKNEDSTPEPPSLKSSSDISSPSIPINATIKSDPSGRLSPQCPLSWKSDKGLSSRSPPIMSSSISSCVIPPTDYPHSPNEPNTLDLLQRTAQQVLSKASKGLLANSLMEDFGGKGRTASGDKRDDAFFKHRCRYCGKVFGSDSALQIHIRSHTGERPYKCNVCGNRFTTKGNLKVHFQRHESRFPHIKMNPNPVPEHLDKFHPPLLAQLEAQEQGKNPDSSKPGSPTFQSVPVGISSSHHSASHHSATSFMIPPLLRGMNFGVGSFPTMNPEYSSKTFGFMSRPPSDPDVPENLSKSTDKEMLPSASPLSSIKSEAAIPDGPDEIKEDQQVPMVTDRDEHTDEEINRQSASPASRSDQKDYPSASPAIEEDDNQKEDFLMNEDTMDDETANMEDDEMPQNLCKTTNGASGNNSPVTNSSSSPSYPSMYFPPNLAAGGISPFSYTHTFDPSRDPAIYTKLLPKPGSADNSWESLIEITKTSETSKLQQLVDNIEHKLSDPNQCVICHRVLSCKSALQMHYRTHTGERPFKCKICGRAFTTKGNLKTHMGVHRVKPPVRMLHQCPVCHKKFINGLVLQQHIRLHTGEPTDLTPEQIQAAEVRDYPSLPMMPGSVIPGGFSLKNSGFGMYSGFSHVQTSNLSETQMSDSDEFSQDEKHFKDYPVDLRRPASLPNISQPSHYLPFTSSSSASDMRVSNSAPVKEDNSFEFDFNKDKPLENGDGLESPIMFAATKLSREEEEDEERQYSRKMDDESPENEDETPRTPADSEMRRASPTNSQSRSFVVSPSSSVNDSSPNTPLDLTPRSSASNLFSNFGVMAPETSMMPSALSSLTSSVMTTTTFNPLNLPITPGPRDKPTILQNLKDFIVDSFLPSNTGMQYPVKNIPPELGSGVFFQQSHLQRTLNCSCALCVLGRGNTTCNICFKTFACNSALEIHYRSHTKERPFKCFVCDRGFSTKGNMKQHMLTHKIRDMPSEMFHSSNESSNISPPSELPRDKEPNDTVLKRSSSDEETPLPLPKRPPGLPKHLCHVCNKTFSSSSALQIHYRTHTGDRPFKCTTCGRAFTTRGNLKVHMGTHMWPQGGTSRRGRRLALELPPNQSMMSKRPSLTISEPPKIFQPYLDDSTVMRPPFYLAHPSFNGLQSKLSESVNRIARDYPTPKSHEPLSNGDAREEVNLLRNGSSEKLYSPTLKENRDINDCKTNHVEDTNVSARLTPESQFPSKFISSEHVAAGE